MPRRRGTSAIAGFVAIVSTAMIAVVTVASGPVVASAPSAVAITTSSDDVSEPAEGGRDTLPATTINEFIPADRDLSDCLSVLPKPGCGSEARGGAAQAAVFGAILLGLGVIGGRIAWSMRGRDRDRDRAADEPSPAP